MDNDINLFQSTLSETSIISENICLKWVMVHVYKAKLLNNYIKQILSETKNPSKTI